MAILAYVSRFVILAVEDLLQLTNLGEISVGFAVLSVITSAPELMVAIFSISEGAPGLSIGDLLGSNVFNLGIVVGVLMLTAGFLRACPEGLIEISDILLLSSIIPLILVIIEVEMIFIGLGLLVIFVLSIYREIRSNPNQAKSVSKELKDNENGKKTPGRFKTLIKIGIGTTIIVVSARFTVSSGIDIASVLGIPPIVIGAQLIAIGTSLPELSLSLVAVKRGHANLASANAIGSNLTNLTLVLGVIFVSSIIRPFEFDIRAFIEIISFVLITSSIMWYHLTKGGDCKTFGFLLIGSYIFFQLTLIF